MSARRIYKICFTLKNDLLYQALRQAIKSNDKATVIVDGKFYDIDRLAQVSYDIEEIEYE